MAATTSRKAGQYVEFDEFIDFQLQKTRSTIKATDIFTALAGVAVLCLAYLLVFVVFDHWIVAGGFSQTARWVMLGGLLALSAGWIVWKVVRPWMHNVSGLYAAREIERSEPGLKSSLVNLVDLRQAGRPVRGSIKRALEKRAAVTLSRFNVDQAVDRRPLMRLSYALLALVIIASLYTVFSPKKISGSVFRAFFPAADVAAPTEFEIVRVQPGDVEVVARENLEVTADLAYSGDPPESVTLFYTTADRKFRDVPIEMRPDPDDRKRYRGTITGEYGRGIRQEMSYRIRAGDASAGPFAVRVRRPPIVAVQQVHYEYPKYTGLPERTQAGGHIDAWEGTKVTVIATTDQPVRSAELIFSNTEDAATSAESREMKIEEGRKLTITLDREIAFRKNFETHQYPHFYRIEAKNARGDTDPDPTFYGVIIRRDQPPEVELLDPPGIERNVPSNTQTLPLLVAARDPDFKVRHLELHAELRRQQRPAAEPELFGEPIEFGPARKEVTKRHEWNLQPLRLQPGDEVRFRIEARDNRQPRWNTAFSKWFTLHVVEPADRQQLERQLEQDRQRQQDRLRQADPQRNPDGADGGAQQEQQQPGAGEQPQEKRQPGGDPQEGNDGGEPQPDGTGREQRQDGPGSEGAAGDGDPKKSNDEQFLREAARRYAKDQPGENEKQPEGAEKPRQEEQPQSERPEKPRPGDAERQPDGSDKRPDGGDDGKTPPADGAGGAQQAPGATDGDKPDVGKPGTSGLKKDDSDDPGSPDAGGGQKDTHSPSGGKPESKDAGGGEREQTDDSSNAEPGQADPEVEGVGTPDPEAKDPTSVNDPDKLQRKEGTDPAVRKRSGDDLDPEAKKKAKKNDGAAKTGSKQPGQADPTPKQKLKRPDNGTNPDQRPNEPAGDPGERAKSKKDAPNQPGNFELHGPGPKEGQRSDGREGGEGGSSRQSDQGNEGSNDPGAGGSTGQPGDSEIPDGREKGKPGNQKGPGSRTRPGENGKSGRQGEGPEDSSTSRDAGKQSGGRESVPQGDPSKTPGGEAPLGRGGNDDLGTGGVQGGAPSGSGSGDGGAAAPQPQSEEKNLEYGKKAADLVLRRLREELDRGEIDKEWLERHGFSEQDARDFVKRLGGQLDQLDKPLDELTPREKAKRVQVEELLKSLSFQSEATVRRGEGVRRDELSTGRDNASPAPPEYKDLTDAFRRSLND